jgi:hypothetical protein
VLFEKAEGRQGRNLGVIYASMALANYCFPPVPVEHERAADGKFSIVTRDRAVTSPG